MSLIEMTLTASPYIPGPPQGTEPLWSHASRNDAVTVKSWQEQWLKQLSENSSYDFNANSSYQELGKCQYQPVIVAGSGPSLKKNWQELKGTGPDFKSYGRRGIKIVSALHNFGFFEDRDVMTKDDYYVTLDAGELTLSEVVEGGKDHDEEWYWERTKDRTLIAVVTAYPGLIKKWRGKILWFLTPWATPEMGDAHKALMDFGKVPGFQVGGNVLGACLYFAKAILGASVPIFVGADFSFSYDHKFHSWSSAYDSKFSGVMPWIDIFGNRVWTWQSYFGFKSWFDFMACGGAGHNAQMWINATEGGIMGAYHEGNIQQIVQLDLKTALAMFNSAHLLPGQMEKSRAVGMLHLLF